MLDSRPTRFAAAAAAAAAAIWSPDLAIHFYAAHSSQGLTRLAGSVGPCGAEPSRAARRRLRCRRSPPALATTNLGAGSGRV